MEGSHDEDIETEGFEDEDPLDESQDIFDDPESELVEEEDYGGSEPPSLGGIYALFEKVLNRPSSTKVSNLDKEELGHLGISVRDCMRIALFGRSFGHKKFGNFFMSQAGIISDSSMSKDGWLTELIVTSKKYTSRTSTSSVKTPLQYSKRKWKMFSAKEQPVSPMTQLP